MKNGLSFSTELAFLVKLLGLNSVIPKLAVPENIDWAVFLSLAGRHRVVPQAYRTIKDSFPALLEGPLEPLSVLNRQNTMQMLAHAGELLRVNAFCQKANIPLMVFKGPVHALEIHGGLANRQAHDLDLLTGNAYLDKIHEYLITLGYSRLNPPGGINKRLERFYIKEKNAYSYYHPGKKVTIELHWRLDRYFELLPIPTGELFKHQRPFILNGHSISTLSASHQVFYVLVHGMQHGWFRLFWLHDVACLVRNRELDWGAIFAMAREHKVLDTVLASLRVMEKIFEVPIPRQASNFPLSRTGQKMYSASLHSIKDDQEKVLSRGWGRIRKLRNLIRMKGSRKFAFRVIRGVLILEKDWGRAQLPPSLFFVYYLLRPAFWLYDMLFPGRKGKTAREYPPKV